MEEFAATLYRAYTTSSGGLNYQGKPCPEWHQLPEDIRNHWRAVERVAVESLCQPRDISDEETVS